MAKIINASIDLTKINKAKINHHANGSKYYNITIFVNDELNQYGQDVSIMESQTKEERESGKAKVYLGNGKSSTSTPSKPQNSSSQNNDSDSLPF